MCKLGSRKSLLLENPTTSRTYFLFLPLWKKTSYCFTLFKPHTIVEVLMSSVSFQHVIKIKPISLQTNHTSISVQHYSTICWEKGNFILVVHSVKWKTYLFAIILDHIYYFTGRVLIAYNHLSVLARHYYSHVVWDVFEICKN